MGETGRDQVIGIERYYLEEIFIPVIVLGHSQAELRMGGTGADEDFLVVHGDVLHGQDGFGPETADDEIDLIAGDQPFHGIGSVG